MSSDDETYEEERFQCEHIITESHEKAAYGISVCQQTIPGENEETFLFATCAVNQICIYKYDVVDKKSSVQLIQSYCDSDEKEYFYDCKWTTFENNIIVAAGGLRGVVRIIDVAHKCHLKPLRHLGSVNQIAFASGRSTLMASCCSNYAVFLWDAEAALCLANFVGPDQHIQGVLAVDINHEGTFVVSGGLDSTVCVWSTQEKGIIENMAIAKLGPLFREFRLSQPHHIFFPLFHSSTMHEHYVDSVKWFSDDIIVSKSADHVYCIWKFNVGQKEPNILFRWHRSEKSDIVFDVRFGLSVSRKLMGIGRLDGSIFIWNITTLPIQPIVLTHRDSKSMIFRTYPIAILVPRPNSFQHILKAFPSPKLIHLKANSTDESQIHSIWSIEGAKMDVTNLTFRLDIFYNDDITLSRFLSISILVIQPMRRIDTIFYFIVPFFVAFVSIIMGLLLDPKVIVSILEKPTSVLVGFLAQYSMMPFLAMAIGKIFRYTTLNSLALFVIGCCPGGGVSNQWTVIFEGDVNLSATMSFVSTASSFIMMPLYFYTIGKLYMDELSIHIPFLSLVRSLALVVIPYSIGIALSSFFPKLRVFVTSIMKPMMVCLMLFFLIFCLIVNWYLFKMIDLYTALTAPLLPFLGFLFGALFAWICRRSWKHVKTIGIEAGIQNTGIAFMILMHSFPQPYATQTVIVPLIVGLLTTALFWVIFIIRNQIRKFRQRRQVEQKSNTSERTINNDDKPSLNIEENNKKEVDAVENMQKL
ncbi:unnamed protein product [Rotaria socialis]|uniref:Uncharacterized protein n=1 Tax=Rotaria socialis TaxID=392032 RepID=A0A818PUW1_9BILA|nr:unnamed protein product [Rotaria socialis]